MKAVITAVVVLLLLLNIGVAIYVITYIAVGRWKQSSDMENRLDWGKDLKKVYSKHTDMRSEEKGIPMKERTDTMPPPSLEFLSLLKPVAHFSGLDFAQGLKDSRNENVRVRNWANSEGSERTLCYNDMAYQNGSITVPAAGVYHITSHVKFYVEDNRKNDNSSQTFHHQIVWYCASSRKLVVLFDNVVTECREGINDGARLEYPSQTGGLAQLDAGDHVIVRVSHFDLLKHDRDWHYFDMYLI